MDEEMEELWANIEAAVWVRELHEKLDKEVDFSANCGIMESTNKVNTPKKEGGTKNDSVPGSFTIIGRRHATNLDHL